MYTQQVLKKLDVKVLLRIAVIWESEKKTGSIPTVNGNANSLAKETSALVTRSVSERFPSIKYIYMEVYTIQEIFKNIAVKVIKYKIRELSNKNQKNL